MSLRPRYSLLTLLVLTALVAGGVKLWYGPHHVVMSDPRTHEEESIVGSHPLINGFFRSSPARLEYGYCSSWNTKQIKYLLGHWNLQQTLAFLNGDRSQSIRKLTGYAASQKFLDSKLTPPEHIVALLEVTPVPKHESPRNASQEQDEELKKLFLLSSHRRIYRLTGWGQEYLPVEEVALETIPDNAARDRVSVELAKISPVLQRPFTTKPAFAAEEAAVFIVHCTMSHARFIIQARQIEGNE